MPEILTTVAAGFGFVEGVRWNAGRVWFSDFGHRRVRSMDPDGRLREEAWVPGQPSGLGFTPEGDLLVVSSHDGHVVRHERNRHYIVADIGAIYRGPLNDMLTAPQGWSYISALPQPAIGTVTPDVPPDGGNVPLFLLGADGDVRIVARGLKIPNGLALSADGKLLFVAETLANRILAFPVARDGVLGPPVVHAELGARSPDGIALDRQGRLWIASPFSSEFVRVDADGRLDRAVATPGLWAVSCAVGEDDETLWCGVVETSIEGYKRGHAKGAILLWRAR
jgi:sugar lactone lactonase YvrE